MLGSLLGQLRLAAFVSVFVGFTAASAASLLINQRALIHQHERRIAQTGELLRRQLALLATSPSPSVRAAAVQELGRYSSFNLVFWIRLPDGTELVADSLPDPAPLPLALAAESALLHEARDPGAGQALLPAPNVDRLRRDSYRVVSQEGREFLTHLHLLGPGGTSLWVAEDISANLDFLSTLLRWLLLAWSLCLALTLVAIWRLTSRIIRPLRDLNELAGTIDSTSLSTSRLVTPQAPLEVRQLASGYNTLLDRLSLAWENQREFVSAVSHELRNPLTIISGYLQRLLREGGALEVEQRRALAKAEAETLRMTRLLQDLLELSRSDAGRLRLQPQAVAVDEVVLNSCDLARSLLTRPLELRLPESAAEQPLEALADADRLQQVLLNLIENADKYSAPDLPVRVSLAQTPSGDLEISVIDQGIGIPPEDMPHIFDRFHRAANATAQTQGSGLGLAVVKLLVEAMGGTITVESQLGKGSHFRLHLPSYVAKTGSSSENGSSRHNKPVDAAESRVSPWLSIS